MTSTMSDRCRPAPRLITSLLRYLVLGYATYALTAALLAERLMFVPPAPSYTHDDPRMLAIDGPDGRLMLRWMPHQPSAPVLLHSHGNAEDLGLICHSLELLHRAGWSVLAYDYPGYGHSQGQASERSSLRAAAAAYRWLVEDAGVPPKRIVIHGRSLGSGPSLVLASTQPVAGLILESAFASAFRVMVDPPLLPFDRFDNQARIGQVQVPILLLHGQDDDLIPPRHAQRLQAQAPPDTTLVLLPQAGHNDLSYRAIDGYLAALKAFRARIAEPLPDPER